MKLKAFISIALILILIFTLSGCKGEGDTLSEPSNSDTQQETENKANDSLSLLYSAADSFNPYSVKTDVNRQICKLLYEPLIKIDNSFNPVNALADTVNVDGKTCTVKIKNAEFSDGSSVTGEDVVYSFKLAKASSTGYGQKLYAISSAVANGNTVTFDLTEIDPYIVNVLDFPIIKSGSDAVTNSDSVSLPPIGCGRYKLNRDYTGLEINSDFYGEKGSIKAIKLINAPDMESVSHYTEIGAADMYFSEISDGEIVRMSGKREEINLNNLVYIGVNQNYEPLDKKELRQALSCAINRTKLCEEAYYNNALPATGIFHPAWNETKSVQNLEITSNNEITVENLEQIGYNKLNSSGIRVNSNGTPLKFTLLVNSENRIRVLAANTIASQLKSVGIELTVVEKKYSEYLEALKSGNFQLYLGEIKFTDNMDVSPLFMKDGAAAFGLPKTNKTENETEAEETVTPSQIVLREFYNGKTTVKDVAGVLQSEMEVVPVCYRTGVLFYNEKIENVDKSSLSDIYFSIASYLIK